MSKLLSQEDAMKKNKKSVYAKNTDFSLFSYVNARTKSKYKCKIHSTIFEMLPTNFWNGHGCPKCGIQKRNENPKRGYSLPIRKSNSQIITEFQQVHGKKKYSYSKVEYTKNNIKVEIICNEHKNSFMQTPNKHLSGRGCPLCANVSRNKDNKRSLLDFVKESNKIHKNFYDYSKSKYKGALYNIVIACPIHGEFSQKANDHLNGHGCKKCARENNRIKLIKTNDQVINKALEIHGNIYDYSKVNYKGIYKPITIICPKHKEFDQVANAHLNGAGCPKCNRSKGEKLISNILKKNGIKFIEQHKFPECRYRQPLPFDFFLQDLNICIEYQGSQHYIEKEHWGGKNAFNYLTNNDRIKREFCEKMNIILISIPYTMKKNEIEMHLETNIKSKHG